MKEKPIKYEYIKNLPHTYPVGATFFITYCLYGTLPRAVIEQYKFEKEQAISQRVQRTLVRSESQEQAKARCKEIRYEEQKRYFAKIDAYLDRAQGHWILKNEQVAQLVANKMHEFDGKWYDLVAYCIMSNHVHWVFDMQRQLEKIPEGVELTTHNYVQVERIMQRIKGVSGYEINTLLGTRGTTVWHPESYDHYARNHQEFLNIVDYVLQNPVKAGLVENWEDWKFSYLSKEF